MRLKLSTMRLIQLSNGTVSDVVEIVILATTGLAQTTGVSIIVVVVGVSHIVNDNDVLVVVLTFSRSDTGVTTSLSPVPCWCEPCDKTASSSSDPWWDTNRSSNWCLLCSISTCLSRIINLSGLVAPLNLKLPFPAYMNPV